MAKLIENVELKKHPHQGDYLSWEYDGKEYWCQGEFFVDKNGILHHNWETPDGEEVDITIAY